MNYPSTPKGLRITHYALLLSVILASLITFGVRAQAPTPTDDEVNAIAKQLFCPVCENTPLDVCPTEACRQWRDLIRLKLAEGWTEDEIKQYFVDNYGARVLSEPPRTGFNWLVYIVPPVLIGIGAVILFTAVRSWRKLDADLAEADAGSGEESTPDDEYVARLEEELRQRE
ncbi:MAG: cytochrome c-type biogenesis protein [Chloroflexota bacterium]